MSCLENLLKFNSFSQKKTYDLHSSSFEYEEAYSECNLTSILKRHSSYDDKFRENSYNNIEKSSFDTKSVSFSETNSSSYSKSWRKRRTFNNDFQTGISFTNCKEFSPLSVRRKWVMVKERSDLFNEKSLPHYRRDFLIGKHVIPRAHLIKFSRKVIQEDIYIGSNLKVMKILLIPI